ncbi:MAG: alpha/beta hydrolase [Spirochaetes bacterium]|nr:alpha/beta hydrolase [Spirochaetota bacterium]MBU1078984.1 alpha/beta hydrolase [Spirochaetota bacterium]
MRTIQVEFDNRNGHTLRGTVNLPDDVSHPLTVINLHGFGGSRSGYKYSHTHLARELARNGIACVRFDFFGNAESDGEFHEHTFTSQLEDTEDICAWVLSEKIAIAGRVVLSGQSLGGLVAASAAPRVQPLALILMCPGAAMWQGCRERADQMRNAGIEYADVDGNRFGTAFNYDLAGYAPYEVAKGYHGNVLIVRGTDDNLVDEASCRRYLEVYGDAATYVPVAGGNHNFSSIPAREACERAILAFLGQYKLR